MSVSEPSVGVWRKSSYSGGGNDCVEVAIAPTDIRVRDSKNPLGPRLCFDAEGWTAFVCRAIQKSA
ncbi:MAG: DUF397 domain-containing protein [Candidatus Dormibacteraceae bacterium]